MKYATSFDVNSKSSIPDTRKAVYNAETIKPVNKPDWHSPTSTEELKSEFKRNFEKSNCDFVDNKSFHKPAMGYSDKSYNCNTKCENYTDRGVQSNHVNGHWDTKDTEDRKPTRDAFGNYNWNSQCNPSTGLAECKVSGHSGYNMDRKDDLCYKRSQEFYHWQQAQTHNLRADNISNCHWMQSTAVTEDKKPIIEEQDVSIFLF